MLSSLRPLNSSFILRYFYKLFWWRRAMWRSGCQWSKWWWLKWWVSGGAIWCWPACYWRRLMFVCCGCVLVCCEWLMCFLSVFWIICIFGCFCLGRGPCLSLFLCYMCMKVSILMCLFSIVVWLCWLVFWPRALWLIFLSKSSGVVRVFVSISLLLFILLSCDLSQFVVLWSVVCVCFALGRAFKGGVC